MRRQTTFLVLVLACLAGPSVGRAQTALPPPIYGTDSPPGTASSDPSDKAVGVVPARPEFEVLATSPPQPTPGSTDPVPATTTSEPVHVDGSVHQAGYQGDSRPAQPVSPAASAVAVAVEGPTQTTPGEAMRCAIVVRNLGSLVVAQVRVELTLPNGARLLSVKPAPDGPGPKLTWPIGNLEAGGERRLELDIQTPSSGELLLAPSVSFTAAIGLRTRLERPAFAITQSIPDSVHRGDKVPIAIQVSNNGTTALTNVLVRVKLPKEGLTHALGSAPECLIKQLAVGETQRLQIEPQATGLGKHINEIEATADGGITTTSRAVVNVTETGLTLRLDGLDQLPVGRQGDLRVVLGNSSNQRTPAAHVTLQVPDGLVVVAASPGATTDSARLVSWALPALDPGTSQTATLRLQPRLPGDWTVEATAALGSAVTVTQQRSVHAEGTPGLAVEVRVEEEPLEVGSNTFLEARILNNGTFPAQDLQVNVRLPETVLLVDATGAAPGRVQGSLVSFAPLAELSPRQQAVYRCRIRGLRPGEQRVQVEVLAKGLKQALHEEARCRVLLATLNQTAPTSSGEQAK